MELHWFEMLLSKSISTYLRNLNIVTDTLFTSNYTNGTNLTRNRLSVCNKKKLKSKIGKINLCNGM